MKCKWVLLITFELLRTCFGQAQQPLHGTVNIVLANSHGAVIVTDSRLSSGGNKEGQAPKLFQLDKHTMCSISDFYSFSGPSSDSTHYPANIAIGSIFSTLVGQGFFEKDLPFQQKIKVTSSAIAFYLKVAWTVEQAQEVHTSPPRSELLFVTYEDGIYQMATEVIEAHNVNGELDFTPTLIRTDKIGSKLQFELAGFTQEAEFYLSPHVRAADNDENLVRLSESLRATDGADLSLHELLAIARDLETRTARAHDTEVGGEVEDAEFVGSVASFLTPYPMDRSDTNLLPTGTFFVLDHLGEDQDSLVIHRRPNSTIVLINSEITNCRKFTLNRTIAFNNDIENSILLLDDPSSLFFAPSNKVVGSFLSLGPGVSESDPRVRDLLERYKGQLHLAPSHNPDGSLISK